MVKEIQYPYIPEGRVISHVSINNEFMKISRFFARQNSLDKVMPGAAVIVRAGKVLSVGVNGSDYHKKSECQRVILKCKTGEGYELCEGCHPKNHSEAKAIAMAKLNHEDIKGADLYLWGHWWCCEACWKAMIEASIANVYLLKDSEILFNKEHPDNIVGRQMQF